MKYDILSLVTLDDDRQKRSNGMKSEDHRKCYSIDPDVVYPATLNQLWAVSTGKEGGQELLDGVETADAAKQLVGQAKRLTEKDIELASTPFSKCDALDGDQIVRRADVLELARYWMTRAIKIAVKKPLWLHIVRCPEWRLY